MPIHSAYPESVDSPTTTASIPETGWLIDGRNHDSGTRCCSFSRLRRRAVGVRPVNQPPSFDNVLSLRYLQMTTLGQGTPHPSFYSIVYQNNLGRCSTLPKNLSSDCRPPPVADETTGGSGDVREGNPQSPLASRTGMRHRDRRYGTSWAGAYSPSGRST